MPLPYWVGHFNMRITNRLMNRLAPRLPGFGVVIHTGRNTYRTYHTAVNVFRRENGFIIALTYSRHADWVRNVMASGDCRLVTRGKVWRLTNPRIFHDESRAIAEGPVNLILSALKVSDFLDLSIVDRPPMNDRAAAKRDGQRSP
ncbi:MAG TPA: nitroreductase family deazaflavin-dependent oxidoreductase [Nitrolancea sp.]|jgi:deazaflavin-dependent oxidoreductase (nitroreductase family)|nr:nitroreductase family deazaflavin-dependent oxidoreductase [Nitrolancea sp.]